MAEAHLFITSLSFILLKMYMNSVLAPRRSSPATAPKTLCRARGKDMTIVNLLSRKHVYPDTLLDKAIHC
jgi:hypothetical protein